VNWLISLFFEMFYSLASYLSVLFLKKERTWNKTDKIPILLVHGYIHNSSVWLYHAKKLNKKGFGPIFTVNLGSIFSSIEEYTNVLSNKIDQILKTTKKKKIILIGHSMGGLVSLNYATHHQKKNHIKAIVTIGSPIKGTKMANLALGDCGKQMRPGSFFLRNLNEAIQEVNDFKIFNIASKTDEIIIPYSSAVIGNAYDVAVLNRIGHNALLYSNRVNKILSNWLLSI